MKCSKDCPIYAKHQKEHMHGTENACPFAEEHYYGSPSDSTTETAKCKQIEVTHFNETRDEE